MSFAALTTDLNRAWLILIMLDSTELQSTQFYRSAWVCLNEIRIQGWMLRVLRLRFYNFFLFFTSNDVFASMDALKAQLLVFQGSSELILQVFFRKQWLKQRALIFLVFAICKTFETAILRWVMFFAALGYNSLGETAFHSKFNILLPLVVFSSHLPYFSTTHVIT